jgi:hypothetical protein
MAEKRTIGATEVTAKTASIRHLATSFLAALPTTIGPSEQFTTPAEVDPLKGLSDAPKVLRAQTTKLGLLLINKPLTPSAIHAILTDIESRVLPAFFASAEQVFGRRAVFGDAFAFEVVDLMRGILGGMEPLMATVDAVMIERRGLSKEQVLAVVGKVFSACDDITMLTADGVVGLLLKKVKAQVNLIEDAIAELQEWGEDIDEDAREEGNTEDEDANSEREREKSLEEMTAGLSLQGSGQLPGYRTDLVELLPEATRRADLSAKLCQALSKRRIKKFKFQSPPFASPDVEAAQVKGVEVLHQVLLHATGIQGDIDEVAAGFYDLDADMVKINLVSLTKHAKSISGLITQTWDGHDDDFTDWLATWERLLDKRKSLIASAK